MQKFFSVFSWGTKFFCLNFMVVGSKWMDPWPWETPRRFFSWFVTTNYIRKNLAPMSLEKVWATRDMGSYSVPGPLNSTKTDIWRTARRTKFYNHLKCLQSSIYGVFLFSINTLRQYKMHFWAQEPLNTTETHIWQIACRMVFCSTLKLWKLTVMESFYWVWINQSSTKCMI